MPIKRKRATNRWSDLPIDLLCSILHLLPIKDAICFGAVCPHWRSAFTAVKKKLSFGPSLMLRDRITRTNTFLTSAHDSRPYTICLDVNDFYRPSIIGSSNGWLITLGATSRPELFGSFCYIYDIYDQVYMLDPHTGAKLQLPPAPTTISPICKAIVVPPAPTREGYMVAMTTYIINHNNVLAGLAVAQAGGDRWISLETPPLLKDSRIFRDINYNDGILYALCGNGNVAEWELSSNEAPILKQVVRAPELKPDSMELYIVPGSQHGLLLIARYGEWYNVDPLTYEFDVFSLGSEGEWERITCLRECTLFLGGCSQSMCLSAMDFPELKKDCIYFPRCRENLFKVMKQSRAISFLYSLEDGKVYQDLEDGKFYEGNQTSNSTGVSPIWVMPNLK